VLWLTAREPLEIPDGWLSLRSVEGGTRDLEDPIARVIGRTKVWSCALRFMSRRLFVSAICRQG